MNSELSCTDLIECIKDDDVNVENEDIVVEAVLDWMRHDIDNRKSSFEKILQHVRLPYCRTNYLRHIKDTGDLLTPKCFEYLHEAKLFKANTVHQHLMTSCRTVPRTNIRMNSCLLVVGGLVCVQCKDDKGGQALPVLEGRNQLLGVAVGRQVVRRMSRGQRPASYRWQQIGSRGGQMVAV